MKVSTKIIPLSFVIVILTVCAFVLLVHNGNSKYSKYKLEPINSEAPGGPNYYEFDCNKEVDSPRMVKNQSLKILQNYQNGKELILAIGEMQWNSLSEESKFDLLNNLGNSEVKFLEESTILIYQCQSSFNYKWVGYIAITNGKVNVIRFDW